MDMVKGYGDKNPVVDKSQFVLSLYERITDDRYVIGPKEKSILDRCVERVYSRKRQYEIPTFFTLRRVLQEQDEPEAERPGADVGTVHRRYAEQLFPSYQY